MKNLFKVILTFILTLLMFLYFIPLYAISKASFNEARTKLIEAFEAIAEAEGMGGNVSNLVTELNNAIEFLKEGETYKNETLIYKAISKAEHIIIEASKIKNESKNIVQAYTFKNIIIILILTILAFIILLYGSKIFWSLWIKMNSKLLIIYKHDRKLIRKELSMKNDLLIDEEFLAVLLFIIIIAGAFVILQAFFANITTKPFSEFAILGPEMKIADYPKNINASEPFKLYLYVGNHNGKVMYYNILVKLGNQSTQINETKPMDAPIIAHYEFVLLHDNNYTQPIILTIDKPEINYRLVFELWVYDETSNSFKYHGKWCQLWLNVISKVS